MILRLAMGQPRHKEDAGERKVALLGGILSEILQNWLETWPSQEIQDMFLGEVHKILVEARDLGPAEQCHFEEGMGKVFDRVAECIGTLVGSDHTDVKERALFLVNLITDVDEEIHDEVCKEAPGLSAGDDLLAAQQEM